MDKLIKNNIWKKKEFPLFLLGITLLISIFSVDLTNNLGTDYGIYFSNGYYIRNGLVIYRDFWTHKTPLLPIVLSVWIRIFSGGFLSAWFFLLFTYICSFCVIIFCAWKLDLKPISSLVSGFVWIIFAGFHNLDPTRNGVLNIIAGNFELLALTILWVGITQKNKLPFALLVGFFSGLAFLTRQTSALIFLSIFLWVFFITEGKLIYSKIKFFSIILISGVSTIGILLLFLLGQGLTIAQIIDQIFVFNQVYSNGFLPNLLNLDYYVEWARLIITSGLLIFILAPLYLIGEMLVKRTSDNRLIIALFCWLIISALSILISPKMVHYYSLAILPPGSLLFGIMVEKLLFFRYTSIPKFVILGSIFLYCLFLPFSTEIPKVIESIRIIRSPQNSVFETNQRLNQELIEVIHKVAPSKEDRILILSATRIEIYSFADRLPAIKYDNTARLLYNITNNEYESWLNLISATPPNAIIVYSPPIIDNNSNKHGRDLSTLVRIYKFITKNMVMEAKFENGTEIWIWG
jgi:hypothetical protein